MTRGLVLATVLLGLIAAEERGRADDHPLPLAIGAAAPDFSLQGVDGKTYTLDSFRSAKALVVIFTAVHCPTAEIYEQRIRHLVDDYSAKGRRRRPVLPPRSAGRSG